MNQRKKTKIALEDGTIFEGISFGANGERYGEIVFNTSMTGYQEILTDPSYKGQIVTMTYPLIGNYGINLEDIESKKLFIEGFVVKEYSHITSNWRSQKELGSYLKDNDILGITGIDTRTITRHIRMQGSMKAVISNEDLNNERLVKKAISSPCLTGLDLVKEVSCGQKYVWPQSSGTTHRTPEKQFKVVVIDCGVKFNILRSLNNLDCQVIVVPAKTTAEEILAMNPNGVLLSNGPGDPVGVPYVVETVRKLIYGLPNRNCRLPIMGICLGHQILGLALGGKTYKLKFGHHGGNHPVKNLKTGKISITVQNHGFCIDVQQKTENREQRTEKRYYIAGNEDIEITHINLNDETCEGMRHKKLPIFSVQFHPEASPGPHDAQCLFEEFVKLMQKSKCKSQNYRPNIKILSTKS